MKSDSSNTSDTIIPVPLEATVSSDGWVMHKIVLVNLEIFHKRDWYLTKLAEKYFERNDKFRWFKRKRLSTVDWEISRNNMILMVWLLKQVMEEILRVRIQWVLPNNTSFNICLHLMCPISVNNGMFSTLQLPHGPLILIELKKKKDSYQTRVHL